MWYSCDNQQSPHDTFKTRCTRMQDRVSTATRHFSSSHNITMYIYLVAGIIHTFNACFTTWCSKLRCERLMVHPHMSHLITDTHVVSQYRNAKTQDMFPMTDCCEWLTFYIYISNIFVSIFQSANVLWSQLCIFIFLTCHCVTGPFSRSTRNSTINTLTTAVCCS